MEKTEKKKIEKTKIKKENNIKSENKPNNKGKIILIIVIVLLLAISGVSAGLLINNMKNDKNNEKTEQKETANQEDTKQDEETEEVNTFKVIFDSNGGSLVDMVTVNEGEVINKPENPTRDGYTFQNWTLDDKEYNFETPVNGDITLKATWKKKTTSSSSSSSSSSSKSSTSSKNKTNTTASTINKINLNEFIRVKINYSDAGVFYYLAFIDNLKDVFPNVKGDTFTLDDPTGYEKVVIKEEDFMKNYSKLKFNTTKEQNTMKILNSLKNKKYKGIAKYTANKGDYLSFPNGISYSYSYLDIMDTKKYKKLQADLDAAREEFFTKITTAKKGAYYVGVGYAVLPTQYKVLDEELCKEYNLTCDRW